jgi:hypothetical protein
MRVKSWYDRQSDGVKVAIVTGLLTLVGAIIAGAFGLVEAVIDKPRPLAAASTSAPHNSPSPIATTATSFTPSLSAPASTSGLPTPKPSAACHTKLHLTVPVEDAIISDGSKEITFHGTACGLGSDSGWLFDYDPEQGFYYFDYNGSTPMPAVQPGQNGTWQFPESSIGDKGDQNKRYAITLVLASPLCTKSLLAVPQTDGDYKVQAIPTICTVVQKVDVYVTQPQS